MAERWDRAPVGDGYLSTEGKGVVVEGVDGGRLEEMVTDAIDDGRREG